LESERQNLSRQVVDLTIERDKLRTLESLAKVQEAEASSGLQIQLSLLEKESRALRSQSAEWQEKLEAAGKRAEKAELEVQMVGALSSSPFLLKQKQHQFI